MPETLTTKPLDFFKPDQGNPRKICANEELRALGESLKKRQIVPVLARPDGTIIDGHRRLLGGRLVGLEKLDVIITDSVLTPAQIKEIQMVSFLHRADLKHYEFFVTCKEWLNMNPQATAKELAGKIDRDASTLAVSLSLTRCVPSVHQAAAEGKLGPSEWYAISKVPATEQEAMLAAKLAGASRDQLASRGRKIRSSETSGIKVNRLKVPLGQDGRSVTIAGSNLSLDDAIEILQETLKFARKAQSDNLDGRTWVQVMQQKAKN